MTTFGEVKTWNKLSDNFYLFRIYIGNSTFLKSFIVLLMNLKLFITKIVVREGVNGMC
jgi:hypothetical protein